MNEYEHDLINTKCWYFDFSTGIIYKIMIKKNEYCMPNNVIRLIDNIQIYTKAHVLRHDKHQVIHIKMINMEM